MARTLKVGIAGYAGFGAELTRAFQALPNVEIVGVFNRGEERRRLAAQDGFNTFDNYDTLLAHPGLDGVVVATANAVHAEQCIRAAQAGKHVFCEKPLTLDLKTFNQIVDACQKAGVVTHLDMTMRYNTTVLRIAELAQSGKLGRILSLWVRRCRGYGLWSAGKRHPDIAHPEDSGGWNIHHNIHGTDLLISLAGQRVVEVYCKQTKSSPDTPCEELISAMLTFADGTIGTVSDSTSILREDDFGLIGERGTAVVRHHGKLIVKMEDGGETTDQIDGDKNLVEACRAFADACLGISRRNVPFEDGRHCLEVLLAMNRSAKEGGVVRLPPA
jgi:myo-inositol 2-dehydrogenase/D-chiro-inositol 1-dehydrogenase